MKFSLVKRLVNSVSMEDRMDIAIVEQDEPMPRPERPFNRFNYILEHTTTVSHVAVFAVCIYIVYLCFLKEFVFFTWHPLLFAIGWMLFMTEGVLTITKDNVFTSRISYKLRVRGHWILQALGSVMYFAGFTIVVINKDLNNKQHFKSFHGLIGLISIIFSVPTILTGVLALFNVEVRKYIPPKLNKFAHAVCGIATVVLGGVTMVLSLYTNWFKRNTDGNRDIFIICYILIVFGILWSLVRPLITFWQRLKTFKF